MQAKLHSERKKEGNEGLKQQGSSIQVILFEIDFAIFTQIYMNCFVSS